MTTRQRTLAAGAAIALVSSVAVSIGHANTPTSTSPRILEAGAATDQKSPAVTYDRSCEKKAKTQPAMNGCVALELREVTPQLKAALTAESRKFDKKLVTLSEAKWERYRDSECALEATPYTGGSVYPLIRLSCELHLTVQRIEQIRQFLNANSH